MYFQNFTNEENKIANEFLLEALPYFESIKKTELFNQFFNLINTIKNEKSIKNINVMYDDITCELQYNKSNKKTK